MWSFEVELLQNREKTHYPDGTYFRIHQYYFLYHLQVKLPVKFALRKVANDLFYLDIMYVLRMFIIIYSLDNGSSLRICLFKATYTRNFYLICMFILKKLII